MRSRELDPMAPPEGWGFFLVVGIIALLALIAIAFGGDPSVTP